MSDVIQLLPDSIANQIAAGEVVQRPASVVKELVENAIDAGADRIQLIIKDAGKSLIQVIDNGSGMSETDARMSMERHATSKIRKTEDLFTIRTMGFRGEALASVAAVSQLEMKTRRGNNELGTLLSVEASEIKKQEPTACDKGTSIAVRNLFFNIPARRNFLKSNPVETRHILDEFNRLALSHEEIMFSFVQGDDLVHDLPPGKLSHRIVNIFGKNYREQLAPCQEETEYVKVTGYVGRPDFSRKTRGEQFLFVNRRFVRNNYLNHAVMTAYEGLLPAGSYPFYVLFIEINPKHIDINVHPTKTEIKFDDERSIYAVVRSAARQALGSHNLSPAIDFAEDINIISKLNEASDKSVRDIYFEERFHSGLTKSNRENWEKLFHGEGTSRLMGEEQMAQTDFTKKFADSPEEPTEQTLGQLGNSYILRQVRGGLMIIDQQAAHERILYEKFLKKGNSHQTDSQQCLFPQTVEFSAPDFALIMEIESELNGLGFHFEPFGKNALVVTGVPAGAQSGSEKQLFEGLIQQFKENQDTLSVSVGDNLARSLAKRMSLRRGQALLMDELRGLVDSLFACKTPNFSPEGLPTFFILDLAKIETYFNRQ